jgi:transposase-like protein
MAFNLMRVRTTTICRSKHYPFRKFKNLPPSPIRFDADRCADFFNKEMLKKSDLGEMNITYQACQLYVSDLPFNEIKRRLGLHQQQLKRHIQKGLKCFVENYVDSTDQKGSEKVNPVETAPLEEKTPK